MTIAQCSHACECVHYCSVFTCMGISIYMLIPFGTNKGSWALLEGDPSDPFAPPQVTSVRDKVATKSDAKHVKIVVTPLRIRIQSSPFQHRQHQQLCCLLMYRWQMYRKASARFAADRACGRYFLTIEHSFWFMFGVACFSINVSYPSNRWDA